MPTSFSKGDVVCTFGRTNAAAAKLLSRVAIKDERTKFEITFAIFASSVDEWRYWFQMLGKMVIGHDKLRKIWTTITLEKDQASVKKVKQQFETLRVMMKSDPRSAESHGLKEEWFRVVIQLWRLNWDRRMAQTIKPMVGRISHELDREWCGSLKNATWTDYFHAVYGTKGGSKCADNKYRVKGIVIEPLIRAAYAMHCALTIAAMYHPDIKACMDKNEMWGLKTMLMAIKFVLGIWPTFVGHFWVPVALHDARYVSLCNKYGLRLLVMGWYLVFFARSKEKWISLNNFGREVMPVTQYGWVGMLNKLPVPQFMKAPLIQQNLWNNYKRSGHYTEKYTVLGVAVMAALSSKHCKQLKQLYGNAAFVSNNNFESNILRTEGVEGVMKNYIKDQQVLPQDEEKAMQATLENLKDISFGYLNNDTTVGISYFWQYHQQKSLVYCDQIVFLTCQENTQCKQCKSATSERFADKS